MTERMMAELMTYGGHTEAVTCIAFSPDGTRIVSASWDGTVRLWDTATGAALRTMADERETDPVNWCAFTSDGERILSSQKGFAGFRVWDAATGDELKRWTDVGNDFALSPDGTRICSAHGTGDLHILDADTGDEVVRLGDFDTHHPGTVDACAFSRDGKRVCSGGADETVRVWDADSGALLAVLEGQAPSWSDSPGKVKGCAFSPDGERICSTDSCLRVWELSTSRFRRKKRWRERSVLEMSTSNCTFSPDGTRIVAGGYHELAVWDGSSAARWGADGDMGTWLDPDDLSASELAVFKPRRGFSAWALSPDGTRICTSEQGPSATIHTDPSDCIIRLWDTEVG